MAKKIMPYESLTNYKKKQQLGPFLIGALAVVLVVAGIFILIFWLTGPKGGGISLFATRTPTPTATFTPTPVTPTSIPTNTPLPSETPTVTPTPTATGPFEYVIQEGEYCSTVAERFNADLYVLIKLNEALYGKECNISVGSKILVPPPGAKLPTPTPVDLTQFSRGYIFKAYEVQPGDYLGLIAEKFNSTVEAIVKQNKLASNALQIGQVLDIPVNLVTPVPTKPATITPTVGVIAPTATP
jgi:LysM repeat protein